MAKKDKAMEENVENKPIEAVQKPATDRIAELEQQKAVDAETNRAQADTIKTLKQILLAISANCINHGHNVQQVGFDIQGALKQLFPQDFQPQQPAQS